MNKIFLIIDNSSKNALFIISISQLNNFPEKLGHSLDIFSPLISDIDLSAVFERNLQNSETSAVF